jgi:hypothetical protein
MNVSLRTASRGLCPVRYMAMIEKLIIYIKQKGWLLISNKVQIILILIVFFILAFSQESDTSIIPGEILVGTSCDIFKFPLKYSGAFVSFPNDSTIQIDSLIYLVFDPGSELELPDQRIIYRREIVAIDKKIQSELAAIYLNLPKNLILLLKNYGVYYIKRAYDGFSYTDTIPRLVWIPSRKDSILIKDVNQNRRLFIKFENAKESKKFVNELLKIECIEDARLNQKTQIEKDKFYREKYKLPYN